MSQSKAVIKVLGGSLQAVYVTPDLLGVKFILLNYDDIDGHPFEGEEAQAEQEIENKELTLVQ